MHFIHALLKVGLLVFLPLVCTSPINPEPNVSKESGSKISPSPSFFSTYSQMHLVGMFGSRRNGLARTRGQNSPSKSFTRITLMKKYVLARRGLCSGYSAKSVPKLTRSYHGPITNRRLATTRTSSSITQSLSVRMGVRIKSKDMDGSSCQNHEKQGSFMVVLLRCPNKYLLHVDMRWGSLESQSGMLKSQSSMSCSSLCFDRIITTDPRSSAINIASAAGPYLQRPPVIPKVRIRMGSCRNPRMLKPTLWLIQTSRFSLSSRPHWKNLVPRSPAAKAQTVVREVGAGGTLLANPPLL
ncbi:hypothetical protein F5878DRAFT_636369 [Lentinula raphanica]|uniref:Uncharacterized protein n=1 Tax=Lentinula raphanica TaxID=153919 RepID=A0AA38NV63_9AGAR|nr:hypothetical protein F5878DRAFT_636369 [Lentinula raphanica]